MVSEGVLADLVSSLGLPLCSVDGHGAYIKVRHGLKGQACALEVGWRASKYERRFPQATARRVEFLAKAFGNSGIYCQRRCRTGGRTFLYIPLYQPYNREKG